jgi:hypothetical protein
LEDGNLIGQSTTTGTLTRPLNSSVRYNQQTGLYIGKYMLAPLFNNVFAEKYELHLCLPENAELIHIDVDIPILKQEEYIDQGVLEFYGKTCHKFIFKNVWSSLYKENFQFSFKYDT